MTKNTQTRETPRETPAEAAVPVAQQVPEEIAEVIAKWGEKQRTIASIDAELAAMDRRMEEFARELAELRASHAEKGRERTKLVRGAELLRHMAEQGCAAAGVPLPKPPVIPPAREPAVNGVPNGAQPVPSPAAAIDKALTTQALAIEGDPNLTRADTPGGEAPGQGGFQPGGRRG
ncbi:hypothetical protein [Actinomadura nitritigenes]|uniref:hypothetical protein n=1 Tax=Actinomadura nitritigenes TaxID=134602 RepID=UPI003D8C867C